MPQEIVTKETWNCIDYADYQLTSFFFEKPKLVTPKYFCRALTFCQAMQPKGNLPSSQSFRQTVHLA